MFSFDKSYIHADLSDIPFALLVSFVIASDFLIIFSSERDGMSFVEFHVSSRIFVAELHMHYFLVLCDLKRLN